MKEGIILKLRLFQIMRTAWYFVWHVTGEKWKIPVFFIFASAERFLYELRTFYHFALLDTVICIYCRTPSCFFSSKTTVLLSLSFSFLSVWLHCIMLVTNCKTSKPWCLTDSERLSYPFFTNYFFNNARKWMHITLVTSKIQTSATMTRSESGSWTVGATSVVMTHMQPLACKLYQASCTDDYCFSWNVKKV